MLGLGGLLAARVALLWPGRGRGFFWAFVAITFLLNSFMLFYVQPDREQHHLLPVARRQYLWLVPAALAARLLMNPTWPKEALGFPVGFLIAGGCEEPLFRGFLWGYLKGNRWPEWLIWIFQAGLFGLAHAYYFYDFADPWIWQRTFLGGLIFGLIAWKTRSVVASALVHGVVNM